MPSPSIDPFTMGNGCSAIMAARTKKGMKVSRAPLRCSKLDLSLLRRLTMRVMSTSNMQWTWALVRRDSIMRCAMILRIFVIGTRSPGMVAGGEVGRDDGAGTETEDDADAGALAVWGFSRNDMMSCFVIRPPMPVPETCERFMSCSRAILRTNGEERA